MKLEIKPSFLDPSKIWSSFTEHTKQNNKNLTPDFGGQFAPAKGGQFLPAKGGHYARFFHLRKRSVFILI
jgi:hypothetical protein